MKSYQNEIRAYFDAHLPELLEDIKTLVRIRSDRGDAEPGKPFGAGPRAALDKAIEMGRQKGFEVKNYDN